MTLALHWINLHGLTVAERDDLRARGWETRYLMPDRPGVDLRWQGRPAEDLA